MRPRASWTPTVAVSAIGMFAAGGGWGVPLTPTTLMVTVGGIARRPVVVGDDVETREYLSLTVTVDHDIVDGAPAARYAARLCELIEQAAGLAEPADHRHGPSQTAAHASSG
ncbi:MAG TPA: 2-oxo acid dehydrogenase subunit E2 [Euzebyales bacterium]|nr:2-oxo acid dehydrogenase subunit E2 [Euzebyales bacterium]